MHFLKIILSKFTNNGLVKNSYILFLGSMSVSVGNYIFHLVAGRALGPVGYGILASLISVSVILSIPMSTINMVIVKLASNLKADKNYGELHFLLRYLIKRLSLIGLAVFLILCIISPKLANFLQIPSLKLILILNFILFLAFLMPATRGIIQGLQLFKSLTWNLLIEAIIKTSLGAILVLTSLKVYGALGAIAVASLIAFIVSFLPLRFLFLHHQQNKIKDYKIISYTLPVFLTLFCFTTLYNIDIVMVKHFLPAKEAGLYSALSKLSQIIFFATGTIAAVMFPMVSEKHKKGESHHHLLWQSLKIVGAISGIGVIFYFLFPHLIIRMLFGSSYLAISPLLGFAAAGMFFLSLNNILINYYLSIHKFKFIYILVAASILEILLILIRHHSIKQIVFNLLFSLTGLFGGLLIFYFKEKKRVYQENKPLKSF